MEKKSNIALQPKALILLLVLKMRLFNKLMFALIYHIYEHIPKKTLNEI